MGEVTINYVAEERKQNFRNVFKTSKDLLCFVWRYKEARKYTCLSIMTTVLDFLFSFTVSILPGFLVNELTNQRRMGIIITFVTIISLSALFLALVRRIANVRKERYKSNVSSELIREFDMKSAVMDYEELEKPAFQEECSRISGTISAAMLLIDRLCAIISSVFFFISSSAVFSTLNPLLLLIIIAITIINSFITKSLNKKLYENKKLRSKKSLLQSYLRMTLYYIAYAKEIRIFDAKKFFADKLYNNRSELNEITIDNTILNTNAQILYGITNAVQSLIMYGYIVFKIISGVIQVGSMLIYINAISMFSSSLSGIITGYLNIAKFSLDDQDMLDYMKKQPLQYQSGMITPAINSDSVFEFRNVSFRYPGSDRFALHKLNLTLNANKRLCIVGENGAGKSTFIKLLLRLYTPTSGEILLDGVNINEFDYEKYLKMFSAVFQDYNVYPISMKENITFNEHGDGEKTTACFDQVGLKRLIEKLPKGIETSVYKWVDPNGFIPSGGEGQRIAIARALYHGGEIYILDEPTAALDPNAEYEIYTQFHNMIKDKTAILVTHRLSAVQLADKVAVFDDGQIIEYGTHTELYAKGGKYREMFDKQAQFYVNANHDDKEDDPINQTSNN